MELDKAIKATEDPIINSGYLDPGVQEAIPVLREAAIMMVQLTDMLQLVLTNTATKPKGHFQCKRN